MIRPALFKQIFFLITLLIVMHHYTALAGDVVVVQSAALSAYTQALEGFESVLLQDIPTQGPKSIRAHSITSHILSEIESPNLLRKNIIKERPDLLLVIGSSSLSLVKNITDIPIVYLMVPYPELVMKAQDNITGINMQISAEQQLKALIHVIPRTKNVGLLYDPQRSGEFVKEAQKVALQNNILLTVLPVNNSSEVLGQLNKLTGKVDSFWMIPDRTVITPQTIDHIFLHSLENRMPVLTFSKKYLDMGAVLSVSFDIFDMGKQAGEVALKILKGENISRIHPEKVRNIFVQRNETAAKMLGIVFEGVK